MKKNIIAAALGLSLAMGSGVALAQFGGLAKLGGGSASASAGISAEDLVKKYVSGTKNVLKADTSLLSALGLKDQAARAELSAKNLTEGATSSALEDAAKIQTENSKLMAEKFAEKKIVLDAEGKKNYAKGLLELAQGIKDYTGMGSDVKNFKPSPTSIGAAAGAAMYVVKSLPDNTTNLMSTLKRAVEFAKENKIEIPAEATSLL